MAVGTVFGMLRDRYSMLIATDFGPRGGASKESFKQRAKEMKVYLVTDAARLDDSGWADAFKCAWRGETNEEN